MGLKRQLLFVGVLAVSFLVSLLRLGFAQGEHSSAGKAPANSAVKSLTEPKEELTSDGQKFIMHQQKTVREHGGKALNEEQNLFKEMDGALKKGDFENANKLKAKLKIIRDRNIQQEFQNMQRLREYRQKFAKDMSGQGQDVKDRREDFRDRKEDIYDRRHDGGLKDRLEDIKDRREDLRDRREDVKDRREDFRDRKEDFRDRREDVKDRREDFRGRKDDFKDRPHHNDQGVRDHGAGIGAGKGQGGEHRTSGPGPRGGAGGGRK